MTIGALEAAESGDSTLLRDAVLAGHGAALAAAYGAGRTAADDWYQCVVDHRRRGNPGSDFDDAAVGAGFRCLLVELAAAGAPALFTAGGPLLPVPLQSPAVAAAVSRTAPGTRVRGVRVRPVGALPGGGCVPCQLYRGDLLGDRAAVNAWLHEVDRARARAFAARVTAANAPSTVLLLDESVLHWPTGGQDLHAGQMRYLARLAETASFDVRVVPLSSGPRILAIDHAQYMVGADVLTVGLWRTRAVYEAGADPRLADLHARSLSPGVSLDRLRQAAGGRLASPWQPSAAGTGRPPARPAAAARARAIPPPGTRPHPTSSPGP
ncbi:Scr1 family TA system antitoxin-like transcriptional regulator [Kitasatospora sp. NPDC089797]|uniref:Scr1 family TA system antitoxin-like transcriptional regulator n=1 Tax=Kitasatospora sp. NPDC089797 TaxID=3155298 RepID=UPI00342550D3